MTLDEDVVRLLQERVRRSGESFEEAVNSALRRGLSESGKLPRFKVTPKACGFRSGVDVLRLNQLADELEREDFQRS